MEKWFIINNDIDFKTISEELGISPIMGKILANRNIDNIESADRFINSDINKLHSPDLFYDIEKAGNILKNNIENKEKIRIVGDYDVDGVMSTYILYTILKKLGGNVDYMIPNRIEDGYGINKNIVGGAKEDGVRTILTCDNGIAALDEVEYAKEIGLDIIITDHHDLPYIENEEGMKEYISPSADAVVNPKNPKCKYPYDKICGATVAYKLMEYLWVNIYKKDIETVREMLEFAGIATICDVVELKDENRIIVKEAMKLMNNSKNLGFSTLVKIMEIEKIEPYHIGFMIGPAINASGRLDTASKALELFLTDDLYRAQELARELKELNDSRKSLTEEGFEDIVKEIENTDIGDKDIIVAYKEDIHESVAGIIAGRIKDKYNKPTIVLTKGEEIVKGSARSIDEYNIFEGLTQCKHLLDRFGGHPMAAGLSLAEENIDKLREELNENSKLTEEDLTKKYYIDLGLPIDYLNYQLIEDLDSLEPYGIGNPKPIFGGKHLRIKRMYKLGKNKNVLKFNFESEKGCLMDGILFRNIEDFEEKIINKYGEYVLSDLYDGTNEDVYIDIIYSPSINEFRGKISIQVIVENYRI